jgi:hypothetical protein
MSLLNPKIDIATGKINRSLKKNRLLDWHRIPERVKKCTKKDEREKTLDTLLSSPYDNF